MQGIGFEPCGSGDLQHATGTKPIKAREFNEFEVLLGSMLPINKSNAVVTTRESRTSNQDPA